MAFKVQFLLTSLSCLFLFGCVTGPRGSDYREFVVKPQFQNNFYGSLKIVNKTGESMKELRWDNDNDQILNDLKKDGKTFIQTQQERTFTFTYFPCEETGLTPTSSKLANGILNIITLGIWPVGTKYICRVDLDVSEPNDKLTFHYTTDLEIEHLITTLGAFNAGSKERARWRLPARRLLKMYENTISTTDQKP